MPQSKKTTKTANIPGGRDNIRFSEKEIAKSVTTAKEVAGPNWSPKARAAADRIIVWLDNPKVSVDDMCRWSGVPRSFVEQVAEHYGKSLPAETETPEKPKKTSPYIREPRHVEAVGRRSPR